MQNPERFAVEWTKAQPAVAGYIALLVPDFHQTEEILQQVALTMVRKFDQYDPQRPFMAWAIGIARLEVLKHRRGHATEMHLFNDDLVQELAVVYEEMTGELDLRHRALIECIRGLDDHAQQVVRLRYVEDLKPRRIAERLELPAGNVRVLLHRIRGGLQKCIEQRMKAWSVHEK